MPEQPNEPPKSQRSVLAVLGERSGLQSKVLLPDSDSGHGNSSIVDPGASAAKLVPQGRGNYQLLGEIARGGMGVILKGHDTDLGRDVAVKVLDGDLAKRPEVVQRFVEEAQIGGQLQHPGIVPVYELGLMADERPYFTMKLIKGHTLASLMQQRKTTADNRGRLLAIFESVCQTVAYAHSKGVLHRDLKPANIMVGSFGEVQVVDWGLAKVLRRGGVADEKRAKARETIHTVIETVRSGPRGSGSTGSDSMIGSVMGTPAYMAPEQAQGEVDRLDERADVFSLGAILCELLTAKPPYLEIEGEPVLAQAAQAKLDPARSRIEACDADATLKQLCLACLAGARAARPANAGEVAKALHEFLASVEDRAHKAEIAAEKARVKAAEERRARRLTLALGGTIAAALVLGGGGVLWSSRERAKRLDEMRRAVDAAQAEAIDFGRAGKLPEALASAQRALSLAESGGADAQQLDHLRSFVGKAEQDLGAAERERARRAKDEALRERLIDLRIRQIAANHDHPREIELDAAFAKAFRDYGAELETDDLVPALKLLRESSIRADAALALDDWGRLRRHVQGASSRNAENVFMLAMDLDPDPERARMREAISGHDRDVMLELTSAENLKKLEPGSISVLCAELWGNDAKQHEEVLAIFGRALQLYPGDFVLQAFAGAFYQQALEFESALSCRAAALSLRPADPVARADLAESLVYLGRLNEAQTSLSACLASDPANVSALYLLGAVEVELGDYAGALASLSRSRAIESDAYLHPMLHLAQFYAGAMARDAFEANVPAEVFTDNIGLYLLGLVEHPDPGLRDPAFVLRTLQERATELSNARWRPAVEAIAHARLEHWEDALAALGPRDRRSGLPIPSATTLEFLRTLVLARLGRAGEARLCYERGMAEFEHAASGRPGAWEHSDAMRWRREAEAEMKK